MKEQMIFELQQLFKLWKSVAIWQHWKVYEQNQIIFPILRKKDGSHIVYGMVSPILPFQKGRHI